MLPDTTVLESTLRSNTNWYSGIPIKNYLMEYYFSKIELKNTKIKQGFWSAYSHLTLLASFQNILSKYTFDTVSLDPFLPTQLIDFATQDHKSTFFSVDQNTLSPIDLIDSSLLVLYLQTGNTIPYKALILEANSKNIPVVCILDTGYITHNCIELISMITLGSVIICENKSTILTNLNNFIQDSTATNILYLSYVVENRITSSLEYTISTSKDSYKSFLHSLYVFIQTQNKLTPLNWGKQQFTKYLFGLGKDIPSDNIQVLLIAQYKLLINNAIPDCIFILFMNQNNNQLLNESIFSSAVAGLHSFFSDQVKLRESGTLMIPPFITQEVLTRFIFFTTDKSYWKKQLIKQGYSVKELITTSTDSKNAFVSNFGLLINL